MDMSTNKQIGWSSGVFLLVTVCKTDNGFLLPAKFVRYGSRCPVGLTPAVPQRDGPIGMQGGKEGAEQLVAEYGGQDTLSSWARPQHIAMADDYSSSPQLKKRVRIVMQDEAALIMQVAEGPNIMVTAKEVDGNTSIA